VHILQVVPGGGKLRLSNWGSASHVPHGKAASPIGAIPASYPACAPTRATPHWRRPWRRLGIAPAILPKQHQPSPVLQMVSPLKARRSACTTPNSSCHSCSANKRGPSKIINHQVNGFPTVHTIQPEIQTQAPLHTGNAQSHAVPSVAAPPTPASACARVNAGRSCCNRSPLGSWITQVNSPSNSQGRSASPAAGHAQRLYRRAIAPLLQVTATSVNLQTH